ncbi:beta-galactosidase GalB [Flavivirga eckloniae]|uniref:Glycoside hydrolase family 2 n=1 Tax=Flavivirga eckloniae TaxID=1803846 RepID=A0A2K9PXX0_9FLAO|nr:beta-galactosidase GalB [Flavivirga eckloniae]AUP81678.1 glycoside hydrolase family 2 [Flavivirga eckloniae]
MKIIKWVCSIVLLVTITSILSCKETSKRSASIEDQNFNKGWLFKKDTIVGAEAINFKDTEWRKLDLPHDWAIEGPFSNVNNARTGGLPIDGEVWYRKHFNLDRSYSNKQVSIEFDGAMANAKVWLNGEYVGERPYGYIGFELDLTPYAKFGEENVIAVKLVTKHLSARWYPGAGIYRNVRLKINDAIHIPQYGTYITTPNVSKERAEVSIETKIKNRSSSHSEAILNTIIKNDKGMVVSETKTNVSIEKESEAVANVSLNVENPKLWDIINPVLYEATSTVIVEGTIVDRYITSFGIRTIEFDREKGFLLNGNAVKLNGVCMHHDQGPLGSAINFRAKQRQMQIMQSMGVNALRTSHNPPSPEILKACDELGIVVIVEAFDEWKIGKVENGYNKHFDEWHEIDLRDMIKRDRNHPSVIMWSIGNEILEQSQKDGWKITKRLNDICHDEDNTRPTTVGFNYFPAPFENKLAEYVDVVGMNYWPENYKEILDNNPEMIVYGSETSSMTSSRGVYHLPIEYTEKHETNHVTSYDAIVGPPWAYLPDAEFDALAKEPRSLGEFIWTGFDYLGEPTPYGGRDNSTNGYWNDDWPSRSSYFGPVDLCGFPKDRYYLYQSQWTTKPMVHVLPHWNWEGKEGEKIPVFAYTNAEEVELFVNGKSYGKKVKGKDITEIPAEYHEFEKGMYKSKYRLSWQVPYQPGALKVVAFKGGKEVATKEIKTAGAPAKVTLIADRTEIDADGNDLSFITVRIEDKDGNICPLADNLVNFDIQGAGVLAAVGNGDQTSLASFQATNRKAFNGLCMFIVKSTETAGEIKITASSKELASETITVSTN